MRKLQNALAHLNIAFALVFLTLLVINIFNPAMQFLSGTVMKIFLLLFCLCAFFLGVLTVAAHRRAQRIQQRRAADAARANRQQGGYSPRR